MFLSLRNLVILSRGTRRAGLQQSNFPLQACSLTAMRSFWSLKVKERCVMQAYMASYGQRPIKQPTFTPRWHWNTKFPLPGNGLRIQQAPVWLIASTQIFSKFMEAALHPLQNAVPIVYILDSCALQVCRNKTSGSLWQHCYIGPGAHGCTSSSGSTWAVAHALP